MATHPIYQFYAELDGFTPKVWRRFQVMGDATVARLGYITQVLFEMKASHLFCVEHERPFLTPSGKASKRMERVSRYEISDEGDDWGSESEDATKTNLMKLDLAQPSSLTVWYDFGDDWRVTLKLEEVIEDKGLPGSELPRVLHGAGFGIVEDCGGVVGLDDLTKAFEQKKGRDYKELSEWLGISDFDITAFDKDDMNFRLKKLPRIYKQSYEDRLTPTQQSIDLIERKYLLDKS